MAIEIIKRYIDDIDGVPLDDGDVTEYHFTWDGVPYEIHLGPAHAAELREQMVFWTEHARRFLRGSPPERGGVGEGETDPPPSPRKRGPQRVGIRAWAREQGWKVGDHGRVHPEIVAAWEKAHPKWKKGKKS